MVVLSVLAAGCTRSEERATQTNYGFLHASPANVKANFDGDVVLSGVGLTPGSQVLIEGMPVGSIPGVTQEFVDPETIVLHWQYAGTPHQTGDFRFSVTDGFQVGASVAFHVRSFLDSIDHVRTLPGNIHVDGGSFTVWARPFDHLGALVRPGHEITGEVGMMIPNFTSEDVQLVAGSGGAPARATARSISAVSFDPVNDAQPLAVALAIDQSGSMISPPESPSDPNDERINQSQVFINKLNATSRAAVYRFQGTSVSEVVAFTSDKQALFDGLESLRIGESGSTPLYDAMASAVAAAAAQPEGFLRAAVVLTDGLDNASSTTPAAVISQARAAGIPVFSIGIGNPANPGAIDQATLSDISVQTGGVFYFAADPSALENVFDSLTEVLSSAYRVEVSFELSPPLATPGTCTVFGKVKANADGEEALLVVPQFSASVAE